MRNKVQRHRALELGRFHPNSQYWRDYYRASAPLKVGDFFILDGERYEIISVHTDESGVTRRPRNNRRTKTKRKVK